MKRPLTHCPPNAPRGRLALLRQERGLAMTEVVLLFPIFMFLLVAFVKIFALLILMQKLEIASFYAARRWQLESHRNEKYVQEFDTPILQKDIEKKVLSYIGYDTPAAKFLDLGQCRRQTPECPNDKGVSVTRTQVWNVVTVTACTNSVQLPFYATKGFVLCSTKYVPNRDRPIAFILPGIKS